MTFIILSLISLLSATCYGAVDIEALKIKAAEYAKNATPIILAGWKADTTESGPIRKALITRLLHITPEDKASDYHDLSNIIKKSHPEADASIQLMAQAVKNEWRNALVQNKSTSTINEIIKKLGGIVNLNANPLPTTKESYWSKFKKLIGIDNENFKFINPWEGIPPLNLALITGQYDIAIDLILQNKESLNIIAENGITPLFCAIDKPNCQFMPELLRFMIEQGANPQHGQKFQSGAMHSILHVATDLFNFKAMQILEEEYQLHDPLLPSARKIQFDEAVDGGILLNRKTTKEINTALQALLIANIYSEEKSAQTVIIPTEKVNLHPDLTLLQAVHSKDRDLISYILTRWGTIGVSKMDCYFALLYAIHTQQPDIVELFKEHGLRLNDLYEKNTTSLDLGKNLQGLYVLQGHPLLRKE
jgi:ankyrin repeat protein